jgi:hypothetical protein
MTTKVKQLERKISSVITPPPLDTVPQESKTYHQSGEPSKGQSYDTISEPHNKQNETSTIKGIHWHHKLENFKGKNGNQGRPLNMITVEDLLKRGQILEREMKYSESQNGKFGRPKELHLKIGNGIVNTTRLVRDNKLTIKKLKGQDPLRPSCHLSDDLKHAILDYFETGNIDDSLNDLDQGVLYSIVADLEHYGNHSPEEFYRDKLLGILKRAELAPINPNLKSQYENLLSIARQLKMLTKASERYYEERAKRVFKYR